MRRRTLAGSSQYRCKAGRVALRSSSMVAKTRKLDYVLTVDTADLTATSVAEGFRTEISDDDCSEVEILGWLYQFYISEKKDAVMARKSAVPT